jgi:adenine-specific DNA methylase
LNPVASLIERATVKWPAELGIAVHTEFEELGKRFTVEVRKRLAGIFPPEPEEDCRPDGYLWARTIRCPYCEALVPLSPNWRLAPNGTGVRLVPKNEKDAAIRQLPPDTKAGRLREELNSLPTAGYSQAMVFTQYTDTMDFLRDELTTQTSLRVMCFSGRGGEVRDTDGRWRRISREEAKHRFREGKADVLLCTDAASEGLNFQFCGALINYDMPWNPMRVEQRIAASTALASSIPRFASSTCTTKARSKPTFIWRCAGASICSRAWLTGCSQS